MSLPVALSGWLFAELAMILVVVAFGSHPALPESGAAPPPPPPSATTDGSPEGLSLQTVTFVMPVTANAEETLGHFRGALDQAGIGPRQIGLVLMFGVSRDGNPLNGSQVSRELRDIVLPAQLPQFSTPSEIRPYLGGTSDGRPGDAKVELFVFAGRR